MLVFETSNFFQFSVFIFVRNCGEYNADNSIREPTENLFFLITYFSPSRTLHASVTDFVNCVLALVFHSFDQFTIFLSASLVKKYYGLCFFNSIMVLSLFHICISQNLAQACHILCLLHAGDSVWYPRHINTAVHLNDYTDFFLE